MATRSSACGDRPTRGMSGHCRSPEARHSQAGGPDGSDAWFLGKTMPAGPRGTAGGHRESEPRFWQGGWCARAAGVSAGHTGRLRGAEVRQRPAASSRRDPRGGRALRTVDTGVWGTRGLRRERRSTWHATPVLWFREEPAHGATGNHARSGTTMAGARGTTGNPARSRTAACEDGGCGKTAE
jgi:hypothetical protein